MDARQPYDGNVATLPAKEAEQNAKMLDKELTEAWSLVATDKAGKLVEVVTARWWMGRSRTASVRYCSVWVRCADGAWHSGHGTAGGYGNCKMSAAFDEAVKSAGIALARNVHGTGQSTVRLAMEAIARAAGYSDCPTLLVEH